MDNWHFTRTELAQRYLDVLQLGISSSLAIIAPRRKGKTLFVLQDLAPLAQEKGYLPVYASLWQNLNAPHEGLISALENTLAHLQEKPALTRLLQSKVRKTVLGNELLGKLEIEFADTPTGPTTRELAYLDQLLVEVEKLAGKRTLLLLIDEVQHLATSTHFSPLAHNLRTLLDQRQGKIKSVFTGSSRHYLNLLLNEANSPFYHFVEQVDFPDLGLDFIRFLVDKLASEFQIKVGLQELDLAFDALDKSPYWMMRLIARLITSQEDIKKSLTYVLGLIETTEDFAGLAKTLKPIDKLLFLALSAGKNPFGKAFLHEVEQKTEVKGVPGNVQRSLQRLLEAGLISQTYKQGYQIEKPGLARFLIQP